MKKMIRTLSSTLLFITAAVFFLSGCSCNYHVRRVQNRCPDYMQVDTSFAVRPAERYDTIFLLTPDTVVSTGSTTGAAVDTFLIEKERVRVQLVRVHDTLLANVELPPDTVAIVRTVTIAPPCPKQGLPWRTLPLLLAFTAIVALWVRSKIKG